MKQVSAAIAVAYEIRNEHMDNLSDVEGASSTSIVNTNLGNSAESYFLDGMFEAFDEAYGDAFLDDETKTYLGEGGTEPYWVDGTWDDDGDGF